MATFERAATPPLKNTIWMDQPDHFSYQTIYFLNKFMAPRPNPNVHNFSSQTKIQCNAAENKMKSEDALTKFIHYCNVSQRKSKIVSKKIYICSKPLLYITYKNSYFCFQFDSNNLCNFPDTCHEINN